MHGPMDVKRISCSCRDFCGTTIPCLYDNGSRGSNTLQKLCDDLL